MTLLIIDITLQNAMEWTRTGENFIHLSISEPWKVNEMSVNEYIKYVTLKLNMKLLSDIKMIGYETVHGKHANALVTLKTSLTCKDDLLLQILDITGNSICNTNEAKHYLNLRQIENSIPHAIAFDNAIIDKRTRPIDLMWALSFHANSKKVALVAINELRGISDNVGNGIECEKCKSKNTVSCPIQTSSGDEPTKLQVRCMDLSCAFVQIIG